MQICTAQHLISHLSVKVPSVGSPGGPSLMSWQVQDRNMDEEQKKLWKRKEREGGQNNRPDMLSHKRVVNFLKLA